MADKVDNAVNKLTEKDNVQDKRNMFKDKELSVSRVPRGLMAKTTKALEDAYQMGIGTWNAADVTSQMKAKQPRKWSPCDEYRQVVAANFQELWDNAIKNKKSKKDIDPQESVPKPEMRTVSVTLNKILRGGFSDEDKEAIALLLATKQEQMSSHMEELQSAVAMAQLEVSGCNDFEASRCFTV